MQTPATIQKREELSLFIKHVCAPQPAVRGIVGIGSIANGLARPDSDIDAIVFLDPFDLYVVPAEFTWRQSDGTFHSIFDDVEGIQLDCARLALAEWRDPAFEWPEGRRAELADGWVAFDRDDTIAQLIAERTAYPDALRIERIDDAVTWLDQHLGGDGPQIRWDSLGPLLAHDRLAAAYGYLAQALFALNRRWRPWRNREMPALLALPWLPEDFEERVQLALNPPSLDYGGYIAQVDTLSGLFEDVLERLVEEEIYDEDPIGEAFVRSHEEPGRSWNMAAWNAERERGERGRQADTHE